ncbi:MAG: nitrate reductase molybdenum cofactor assembly chaperone, partial [Oceanibaculum nanhaiense]|nr:nitrate reductase molybdenum cofactor assembly chaperone [Oceanibaculum nanhaiense]
MKSFKALSALLNYPSAELVAAMPEIRAVLTGEGLVPRSSLKALEPLLSSFETAELYDLQERYVLLFDRSRSLSLHLFEHVHGESRDRGQALVDLSQLYDKNGFFIVANELPDFLPLFLEFLSTLPFGEATAL